jgi:serine/threonine-protein kinase
VTALIDDLLRYQQGFPVEARRGSTFYRLRKLVRRNVPATAFASLALAIATGGFTTYTHDMNDARRLAEDRALTASQTLSALSGLIADTYSELIETRASRAPGQSPDPQLQNEPLRLLLERTERLIDNVMTEEPALEAELQLVQAVTNLQLGRTKQTRKQLESALDLVQQTGNANGEAAVLSEFIALESMEGNSDGARERVRQAFEVIRNHDVRPSIQAGILINAVHVESDLAEYERAIEYAQRAIGILETRHSTKQLARAYVELGTVYGQLEQSEPARRWMRRAVELYTEIEGPSFRGLIPAYSGLAYSHAIAGEYEPALEYFRRELEVARANYGEHHIRTATGLNNIGIALRRMGRYEEAIDS